MRLLVLGGTRSGKSARAERVAAGTGRPVVYVATSATPTDDADFAARIAAHRERRPEEWRTEETRHVAELLTAEPGATVLVDDLAGWLTGCLDANLGWGIGPGAADDETDALLAALEAHAGDVILVSPEVGLGILPQTSSGRLFADALGTLNQRVAALCDRVEFVAAGRVLELPADGTGAAARATGAAGGVGAGVVIPDVGHTDPDAGRAESDTGRSDPDAAEPSPSVPAPAPVSTPAPVATPDTDDSVLHFDTPPTPSREAADAARERQLQLTKPAGSLGRLEELSVWISSCQGTCPPAPISRPRIVVFAGDHGVAAHGVSAFPQDVTVQMVENIRAGGAAINILADAAGAGIRVEDIAVAGDCDPSVSRHKVRRSTGSIDREDALADDEFRAAVAAGRAIADDEVDSGADLLIAGDLGIANTTPSATLVGMITGTEPVAIVGRGTGVDDNGWMRKTAAVRDAMFRCRGDLRDPLALLRRAGGADLAAMTGFLAQAAQRETPVILDGSVVTAAAVVAEEIAPGSRAWWRAGHVSTEAAHPVALKYLGLEPVVDLGMHLGEGTGAAAALPLVSAAVGVLGEMATFGDAGVSEKE